MANPLALIIEDDANQAEIFSMALQVAEFDTKILRDGEVALAHLATITPAIVVLDLHLPHVSGKTILNYIRADERLRQTSVIITTADPGLGDPLRNDADLVLIKPISISQLSDLASRLVKW